MGNGQVLSYHTFINHTYIGTISNTCVGIGPNTSIGSGSKTYITYGTDTDAWNGTGHNTVIQSSLVNTDSCPNQIFRLIDNPEFSQKMKKIFLSG